MNQYYRYDENGYYLEWLIADYSEENPMPENVTAVKPPQPMYKAKFDKDQQIWLETGSPPEPDIEAMKHDAITQTKIWVASELAEPMEWSDGKMYTVTLEKRNMLSNQLGMYERNDKAGVESPLMWNAAGEACEAWTYEDLSALSNAMAAHVAPIVSKQQYAEIRIRQAVTADEIQAVLDGFVS